MSTPPVTLAVAARGRPPEMGRRPPALTGSRQYLKDLSKGDGLVMSVPAPREPRHGGRWETIRYALDNNPRTFRLCLILLVAAVPSCLVALVAELIRHMLLCATEFRPCRLAATSTRLAVEARIPRCRPAVQDMRSGAAGLRRCAVLHDAGTRSLSRSPLLNGATPPAADAATAYAAHVPADGDDRGSGVTDRPGS